ncbi:MAG: BLUF domain-containing protein [Methylobacterium mesophilicum]|nr:BLUF domain-containing protein [Methylobacterium mesophilicum]
MPLHRLLYRSEPALAGLAEGVRLQVGAIVAQSAETNARNGLTGALLLTSDVFIQVLEGPAAALEATFERICRDMRHRRVRLLEIAAAEERVFAEWGMVCVEPDISVASLPVTLEAAHHSRLDVSTAGAAVRMMRALVLTNSSALLKEAS